MQRSNVSILLSILENISTSTNHGILEAITEATYVIFESEIRNDKKDYILGIMEFIDPDGNIDYSNGNVPPVDINERISSLGITTEELKNARDAFNKFQTIKPELF